MIRAKVTLSNVIKHPYLQTTSINYASGSNRRCYSYNKHRLFISSVNENMQF